VTTVAEPPTERPRGSTSAGGTLKVSAYDRVASLVIALVILLGATAACLLLIWLTNQIFASQKSVPVVFENIGGGVEDGVAGESMELDSPDPTEVAQESELTEPQLQETLPVIEEVIASQLAELADPALTEDLESGGGGSMHGDGRQPGLGSGAGEAGIPRAQRWQVYFSEGSTLDEYAAQLDFFGIELGVVRPGSPVEYATNLSKPKPDRRQGPRNAEQRLLFIWREGGLVDADRELLGRAGINTAGGDIVQFFPADVENQLAALEKSYRGLEPGQIRRTQFGVRSAGRGYEFFVMRQTRL
jgi:hypothetical protein